MIELLDDKLILRDCRTDFCARRDFVLLPAVLPDPRGLCLRSADEGGAGSGLSTLGYGFIAGIVLSADVVVCTIVGAEPRRGNSKSSRRKSSSLPS